LREESEVSKISEESNEIKITKISEDAIKKTSIFSVLRGIR
jgi:hypothetical protein